MKNWSFLQLPKPISADNYTAKPLTDDSGQNESVIREELEKIAKTSVQTLLVILPDENKARHAQIKALVDLTYGGA